MIVTPKRFNRAQSRVFCNILRQNAQRPWM